MHLYAELVQLLTVKLFLAIHPGPKAGAFLLRDHGRSIHRMLLHEKNSRNVAHANPRWRRHPFITIHPPNSAQDQPTQRFTAAKTGQSPMARFVTSIFLALILVDLAAATKPVAEAGDHKPPTGLRRMIETLENRNLSSYQCNLEGKERGVEPPKRIGICRGL